MPVTLSRAALRDLELIRTHIGSQDPGAASRIAVQLLAACDRLDYLPERGGPTSIVGVRELLAFQPYVITYRVVDGNVRILRIWHGAQDRQ